MSGMTDRDLDAVRLAAAHYRAEGHRLSLARSSLGLNSTGFYAVVNRAIDDPQVEAALPVEVHRLRRLRAERQRLGTRRLAA